MGIRISSIVLAIVSMVSIGAQARAGAEYPDRVICYGQNGDTDWSFEISEVGEGMLLPAGIYVSVNHRSPWRRTKLFRVRSGIASVRELLDRAASARRGWEEGTAASFTSLDGIHFSAVGVDTTTTASNRGESALVVDGSNWRIGDSFHNEADDYLGKYAGAEVTSCL